MPTGPDNPDSGGSTETRREQRRNHNGYPRDGYAARGVSGFGRAASG